MDRDVEPARRVAAPLVVAGNAVRIAGLDGVAKVAAHEIATIMRLAEPFEPAVAERHRLEHVEQRMPPLNHRRRCRLPGQALFFPFHPIAMHAHLVADHQTGDHDGDKNARGHQPGWASGHGFTWTLCQRMSSPSRRSTNAVT